MPVKTAISFGLVHIPVELNPVIKNNDTSFNMLHKKCLNRIKYQKVCPYCKTEVETKDLVKGYEYSKDEYVIFDDNDFDKLKTDNDTSMEIIAFVNLREVDPVYFDKSYYLSTKGNNKAFSLFKKALEKENKVAIAKTVLRDKSYYMLLRFGKGNILANTLYYEEEIFIDENSTKDEFNKQEMDLAIKLINSMSDTFKPETYKDDYQDKIKEAISLKIDGKEIKKKRSKKQENVKDLMEALEKSIKAKEKK